MRLSLAAIPILAQVALAATIKRNDISCSVVFDGRIPLAAKGADFDQGRLLYNPTYTLGANLTWADVLRFPKLPQSLFDNSSSKAVEVTIDDRAIFTPSPTNVQRGFRRNELLPQPANVNDSVTGIKTLHFSLRTDTSRSLNYNHEYQLTWLENQDYSANQFSFNTGTLYGATGVSKKDAKTLQLRGSSASSPQQTLWKTPLTDNVWHNIGLVLDFTANELEVLYSKNREPLKSQTKLLANDLSNLGQFHFGVLKKPTGPPDIDITREGFQEAGIHEGIVYGGIFEENSAGGCVSLAPGKKGKIQL